MTGASDAAIDPGPPAGRSPETPTLEASPPAGRARGRLARLILRLRPDRWTLAALVIVGLLAVPLLVIALGVLMPPSPAWRHLAETVLAEYVLNSLLLVVGAGSLAVLIGVSTAWLVTTCDFPGRRVFEWALILPLAVPAYVAAYTYAGMLDVTGPVQRLARAVLPGAAEGFLYLDVRNIWSAILIFALVLYPYIYLITRSSFARQSRSVLEAARCLGRGPTESFFRVALPLARPAVIAGLSLVIMEILNDYGAVKYYGVNTFTTGIFRAWFSLGDLDVAIRLSGFLMAVVLIVLLLERLQRGGARYDDGSGTHRPLKRYRLPGGRGLLALGICLVPLLFGFLVPAAQLLYWAARTAPEVLGPGFARLVLNSFGLAAAAAALCVVVGLVLAYAVRLGRTAFHRGLARISVLGYSIPGAVIAVGVLVPFGWLDRTVDDVARAQLGVSTGLILSGTLLALVFAYLVRFMAVAYMPIESGFSRISESVESASRTLGVPPLRTLGRVGLPLLRGTLVAALILVFVDVLKELPLTLIMRPFNFDTLATTAFQLASDEQVAHSASAALVVIGTSIPPVIFLSNLFSRVDE